MNVFWRDKPLSRQQHNLLNLCLHAHAGCVHRDNISTAVVRNVAAGSLNYTNAVAAALMSIGGTHAPLQPTIAFLSEDRDVIMRAIELGQTIPGWGSSFEKEGIDPIWKPVDEAIKQGFPEMGQRIEEITLEMHNHGKEIYPNAACFTAATAILVELPAPIAGWLFVQGRISEWAKIFLSVAYAATQHMQHQPPEKEAV